MINKCPCGGEIKHTITIEGNHIIRCLECSNYAIGDDQTQTEEIWNELYGDSTPFELLSQALLSERESYKNIGITVSQKELIKTKGYRYYNFKLWRNSKRAKLKRAIILMDIVNKRSFWDDVND